MTSTPRFADAVLLLAIDDRARYRTRGPVGVVLAAAELCDQTYADQTYADQTYADQAYAGQTVRVSGSPAERRRLLADAIRSGSASALDRVGQRMTAAGAVVPIEHRFLRVFSRQGYAVADTTARADAERRLRAGLEPGSRPDAWTATLVLLAAVSGIARAVVPPPSHAAGRRAVAEHLNGLRPVVGEAVAEVVDATRRVYRRSGDAGDGFVPVGGAHSYGDDGGDGAGGDGGGGDGGGGGGGD